MAELDFLINGARSVFIDGFIAAGSRVAAPYLATALGIAFILYLVSRERTGKSFWAFALPKEVYTHASNGTDVKLFFLGRLLDPIMRVAYIAAASVTAALVLQGLRGDSNPPEGDAELALGQLALLTLAMLLVSDFCTYWVHRLHHEHEALWPFHAVHHSAEVLTPLTLYRKHPVYDLFGALVHGLAAGVMHGLIMAMFFGPIGVLKIAGVNAFIVALNAAGANLRHSHIWWCFGPVLSRVFISPAQHQIHHSMAPAHHNKNYGEFFALWDWMFGTLYVPAGREQLTFGLADARGARLAQPHPDLRSALVAPFRESFAALKARRTRSAQDEAARA
jgi:sterol desaturase/sphingolipid hydroxylase (fatty acid hydroxylase superfamily)